MASFGMSATGCSSLVYQASNAGWFLNLRIVSSTHGFAELPSEMPCRRSNITINPALRYFSMSVSEGPFAAYGITQLNGLSA